MNIPSSMRALEVPGYDGPESIRLVERPVPEPGPGEVLIRIRAAGVNFADTMQSRGDLSAWASAPLYRRLRGLWGDRGGWPRNDPV